jgi:hypothetical protein
MQQLCEECCQWKNPPFVEVYPDYTKHGYVQYESKGLLAVFEPLAFLTLRLLQRRLLGWGSPASVRELRCGTLRASLPALRIQVELRSRGCLLLPAVRHLL